ncbi:MAG TPA: inositol monophosphatase [Patescibacteria group bacterium]|nr:inositol monophosphatase [Patescibacteria group bacterium]
MSLESHSLSLTPEEFHGEIIVPDVFNAVISAGNLALEVREQGLRAQVKSTKEDLVTQGDRYVSEALKKSLGVLFPGIAVLDEERTETHGIDLKAQGMVAIIDPIDGTSNYYSGYLEMDESKKNPYWGVSVGIMKNGELVAGVIFQPQLQKIYYAEKGKGAYMNGKRIHVSNIHSLAGAKLIYSSPYPKDKEAFFSSARVIERIETETSMQAETLGSQVIEAMQVAEGKKDAFLHLCTKPWDMAAAVVIAREAGGRIMTAFGTEYPLFGPAILISNSNLDVSPITSLVGEELSF